ncbi:MAG: SDR family oxidoreductase [Schleiferiaceae bacterium]
MSKIIIITGGSSGIGKAAAKELHRRGNTVVLQARNLDKLSEAAREISASGERVYTYSTDLTDRQSVEKSADQIIEEVGLPDVVINSAGAGEWLSFDEADADHYELTMGSPYLATALTCKVFYDRMKTREKSQENSQSAGHFIIINSAAAFFSFPGATGYTPARWAMLGFAKSLQADLYDTNFTVSMIALGKVDSPYFQNNPISETRIPKIANWLIPTLSEEEAGNIISTNVRNQKKTVIKPFLMSVFVTLNRYMPGLFRWLMRATGHKKTS